MVKAGHGGREFFLRSTKHNHILIMPNHERDLGEHLGPLPGLDSNDTDSDSSNDSEVEIVSIFDPTEHELVQLGTYLSLGSDSGEGSGAEDEEKENDSSSNPLVFYSSSDGSDDDIHPMATCVSPSSAASLPVREDSHLSPSVQMKRRQWSIKEKLRAISTFEKNKNKYQTSKSHGCTPSQLRKWLTVKDRLQVMAKEKSGRF